tara:strand:+ start:21 stop:476 length:456 start_codon:yes stop_codon:yes gene_type:complete
MATTVTAASLSVAITESITLNGVDRGSTTTATIASIGEVSSRIMSITNAENGTEIISISTAAGVGTYDKTAVKYLRITNLDDTNYILLQFTDSSSHHWELKLEAGKSIILGDTSSIDDQADIDNFSASAIAKVIAKADTAAVDIEIYIAST